MSHTPETCFDSIESARQYLALLHESVQEAGHDIKTQIGFAKKEQAARREQALRLAAYNLVKLDSTLAASRRIVNDLHRLRRLLLSENPTAAPTPRTEPALRTKPFRAGASSAAAPETGAR